ncbi:MAG: FUSC family protein, partial [Acetobacteraceae bacterium]|nr:FUSC family protein [Acetobacteraceae bacterium]
VDRVAGLGETRDRLISLARFCRAAAQGLQDGAPALAEAPGIALTGAAQPLSTPITHVLQGIRSPVVPASAADQESRGLLVPDAFTNPDHSRFALKVTLAVMLCYFTQSMLDWPGIHTCVITCFFVSLGTTGETLHKATLRLVGCLVGAALGIGTILVLMPLMTDLGELLLVVAAVTCLASWIGFGSERISYAGWQLGLAFYLSTFQGFGPTLDMETARDRVVGILFGNIVILVIFTAIWPVSVARIARRNLARAIDQLAALVRTDEAVAAHRAAFAQAIGEARAVMVDEPFERYAGPASDGNRPVDAGILSQVQALMIPVSVILDLRRERPTSDGAAAYHAALADWFQRAATWIRGGGGADEITESLPEPPSAAEPLGIWHRVLYDDIRAILAQVGPHARPAAPVRGELSLAAR